MASFDSKKDSWASVTKKGFIFEKGEVQVRLRTFPPIEKLRKNARRDREVSGPEGCGGKKVATKRLKKKKFRLKKSTEEDGWSAQELKGKEIALV